MKRNPNLFTNYKFHDNFPSLHPKLIISRTNRTSSTNPLNSNANTCTVSYATKNPQTEAPKRNKTKPHTKIQTQHKSQITKTKSNSNHKTTTHTVASSSDTPCSRIIHPRILFILIQNQRKQRLLKKQLKEKIKREREGLTDTIRKGAERG